jgi:hypothetical protein
LNSSKAATPQVRGLLLANPKAYHPLGRAMLELPFLLLLLLLLLQALLPWQRPWSPLRLSLPQALRLPLSLLAWRLPF